MTFYRKLSATEKAHLDTLHPNYNFKYIITDQITERYKDKSVTCYVGELSDGATNAIDLCPIAFFCHDKLCKTGLWDDGTPCTNLEASNLYSKLLWREGHYLPAIYRWPATWLFGGGQARKNGLF